MTNRIEKGTGVETKTRECHEMKVRGPVAQVLNIKTRKEKEIILKNT